MIDSLKRPPGALRWAPRQRFTLSPSGMQARLGREQAVSAARSQSSGREGLDDAMLQWAQPFGIQPGDGVFLEEFSHGRLTVAQVADVLADCGATKQEVQAAVDRMFKAGLLEADPPPATGTPPNPPAAA